MTTPETPPLYLRDGHDDHSQECKDVISSLPKEPGWVSTSLPKEPGWVSTFLHQYQGFWYTTWLLPGVIDCQNHFQAQDSDILLVTTPKSGTTWLKAILFTLLNRFSFPPAAKLHPLLTQSPHDLVPFLEIKVYNGKQVPDLSCLTPPRLFATHLPYVSLPESVKKSKCKIVYLCRNPKDTFVSLWHFTNRLRLKESGVNGLEEAFGKFCKGISLNGPFWEHVLGYWKESLDMPERVLFLKFEEMKEEPIMNLRRLAEFIGCSFSEEEKGGGMLLDILKLCSFDNLSNLEVNVTGKLSSGEENKVFFRKGEVGDFGKYLTAEMIEEMDGITEHKLHGTGLKL
ncbi:cytosolic sulfotransferase 12-like [Tripterygium wilfordii]|uniref:cytosolic sulfotransferase 12-like n=1 Tax=Tripterygium wilfordii TaxID=458696 RepID=UPI0018F863B0|nr:cytosolic sulfotransferase 12-like [Tripterygium wilfordii]